MKLLQLMKSPAVDRRRGMTLLELMVSMALLTVIILGLYSMFNQTQQALLRGAEEVDVQETARSSFAVLVNELDQARVSHLVDATNFAFAPNTNAPTYLRQALIDGSVRTQQLQDLFFLTREGSQWKGVGYFVRATADPRQAMIPRPADANLWNVGVGSLYRFEMTTNHLRTDAYFLQTNFFNFLIDQLPYSNYRSYTNVQKVADGIVHLRAIGYTNQTLVSFGNVTNNIPNLFLTSTNHDNPTHVDIELGVMEPKTLGQARVIPGTFAVSNYLFRASANVLMLRARVPVRIDPATSLR